MSKPKQWTLEKVKEGFEKFLQINGRYPAAYDIDDCEFLPSSRQIQRIFGGLVNLRKTFSLPIENYTKGQEGSEKAIRINETGKRCELLIFELLKDRFDEKFVHIEKPLDRAYKNRYDFYVYAKPFNFAVDVFSTDDSRSLVNIMNLKAKKYQRSINHKEKLYFVCFEDNLDWKRVEKWLANRKNPFPKNWAVMDTDLFEKEILKYAQFKAF
ncbi:MAG TPA: hypothetical protein VF817_05315 [Patescibacteria group bacterium]